MKMQAIYRNRIYSIVLGCSLLLFLFTGCYDSDKVGENFYTFTGNTIGSYLEKNSTTYSEFWKAVKRENLDDLLKSYNLFTCFAPNDSAMYSYYKKQGVTSLEQLPDSIVKYMVYTHLVPDKGYLSSDLVDGVLPSVNMNSRNLTVLRKTIGSAVRMLINTTSLVTDQDVVVENGVVFGINEVLTPSTAGLPKLMLDDSRISLFARALKETGLEDSLQLVQDDSYVPEVNPKSIYYGTSASSANVTCRSPKFRKFGYTVFAESNDVFAKAGIDTTNLDGLIQYAKHIYDAVYPEDAGIVNIKDRRNSLNRFIAYHLIDKTVYYNNFFYSCNMVSGISLFEFMETFCPNTIFKVSNETGGVVINRDNERGVSGVNVLPVEAGRTQDTQNGIYYLIDDILVYNQKVKTMLLNTRIRMDAASLHPELMNNGIRYEKGINPDGVTGDDKYYKIPNGYLKNAIIKSNDTRLYYLQGSSTWCNYQGDEMMALGQFDFIMRLPPVPAGTYEIRFGYTANPLRRILQFYLDDDNGVMQPRGIPLNMKRDATDPSIGWLSDANTLDDGIELDKMLRNRGYMKGGTSYFCKNGSDITLGRAKSGAMRRVVCTETWTHDGPHYLRFKSIDSNNTNQFQIDYFELVPTNVYNNPSGDAEDRL